MRVRASFAVLLQVSLLLSLAGPAGRTVPRFEVTGSPGWTLSVDSQQGLATLVPPTGTPAILVDGDGIEDDGRSAGIYLTVGNRTFQGLYFGHLAPLVVPERSWLVQTTVSIRAEADRATIRMTDEAPPAGPDSPAWPLQPPFVLEAVVETGDPLRIRLRGLYSLLITGHPLLSLETWEGETATYAVPSGGASQTYFHDLRVLEFVDAQGSRFRVETNALVIQIETLASDDPPDLRLFEIDFDHSAKDYGQMDIATTVTVWP